MVNSGVEGRDTEWDEFLESLKAFEPLDIDEINDLCWKKRGSPAIDTPCDVELGVRDFSQRSISLDSEEFKRWWYKFEASSLLLTKTALNVKEWQYLMNILTHANVSRIEHLFLAFSHPLGQGNLDYVTLAYNQLGIALSRRDFSALKTLVLHVLDPAIYGRWKEPSVHLGPARSQPLADAIKGETLGNLRTLSITCYDVEMLLDALTDSRVSQLTSFHIPLERIRDISRLGAAFNSGRLSSLQRLSLRGLPEETHDFWNDFANAIQSGNLPTLRHLHLKRAEDVGVGVLRDLFRKCQEWFASLETLAMDECRMDSMHVCALVDAVREVPNGKLALKRLDLQYNNLDSRAIDGLILLADSHRLPHLETLNLTGYNKGMSKALVTLVRSIRKSSWPCLRKLWWPSLYLTRTDAKAVVRAYHEDQSLTTEIIFFALDGFSWLEPYMRTYRSRNLRLADLREKLGELGDFIQLTYGKVFLCGFPEVGKTTLRRTFLRNFGSLSKLMWETRPVNEPRTRGIEISKIEEKYKGEKTTLVLWDLAGQPEYHVLHGTVLADLGFVNGKSTTFILVFRAPFESDVKAELRYWLGFVASSSRGLVKRHVVIVLNRFDGMRETGADERLMEGFIKSFATKFDDLLDIHVHPFVIDVRIATSVQLLKKHLFKHARKSLRNVEVPKICFELRNELKRWSEEGENRNHLPILTWQTFEERWKLRTQGNQFSEGALKYAASYLHEIGEIMFFEDKKLRKPSCENRSILVPNPEWFCRKVVGELLLPEQMLEGRGPVTVSDSGSICVGDFQSFFEHLLVGGTQSDDIICMLELLGLCYRKAREERGEDEIIVPALISKDDYDSIDWQDRGFHGVMGRCLVAKDKDKNIIPDTLFRRLQVELAQDSDFGGRGDSGYRVGKSFANFKVDKLLVLIQFDVDHSDPTDDRIDVLVKSAMAGDPVQVSSAQVECVCKIMQKLEDLCANYFEGLAYDVKVIQPSRAAGMAESMSQRKLMSLKEITDLVIKGIKDLTWQVYGYNLEPERFLSKKEQERLLGAVQREFDECRQTAITVGLLLKDSFNETEAAEEKRSNSSFIRSFLRSLIHPFIRSSEEIHQEGLLLKTFHEVRELKTVVREEGRHTREHIDKKSTELVLEFRNRHELLVKHIQAQQAFSFEERGSSVPRYMFLSKKQDPSLKRVAAAFQSTYQMHFLCESHFDNGLLHEVKGQEGILLTKEKEWFVKISPWLRRSLQVAIMVGKSAGNVYLPGVFNLIPDVNIPNSSDGSAKAVDRAVAMLLDEQEGTSSSLHYDRSIGTPEEPIHLKERRIAQGVVTDLITELGHGVFAKKIGLRKVLLQAPDLPGESSSKATHPSVLWLCDNCYTRTWSRWRSSSVTATARHCIAKNCTALHYTHIICSPTGFLSGCPRGCQNSLHQTRSSALLLDWYSAASSLEVTKIREAPYCLPVYLSRTAGSSIKIIFQNLGGSPHWSEKFLPYTSLVLL